jgi:hypothetical protein
VAGVESAPRGTVETTVYDVALTVQSAFDAIAAIGSVGPFRAFDSFGPPGALRALPVGAGILSQRCTAEYRQRQRAACYQMSLSHVVLLELRQWSTGKTRRGDSG